VSRGVCYSESGLGQFQGQLGQLGQFQGRFHHTLMIMKATKPLTTLDIGRHKIGVKLDAMCPGLRLVATPGAKAGATLKSWIYRYRRHDGTRGQIKLGEYPRMSLKEAREAWSEAKKARDDASCGDPRLARKAKIAATQAQRSEAYTIRDMLRDYREHHADKLAKGVEQDRMLRHDVLPVWGERAAADITGRDVVDLYERIAKRAPRVAAMTISALRNAFKVAIKRRRIEGSNPCAGVETGKFVPRDRALDEAELRQFLTWLPAAGFSGNVRDALRVTLLTAARSGEVVKSEWSEIDLEAGIWTQPKGKTKNRREHRVMLSRQAVELLNDRRSLDARFAFPSRDNRPLLQKAVGFAQWEASETCPVKDWTVHDLRRTALTGLARLGCPRVVQNRIANHVDNSIAAIYDVHPYDDEARLWLQKWADYLDVLQQGANVVPFKRVA